MFLRNLLGFLIILGLCKGEHSLRALLLLKSGSTHDFDTLWNSEIAINDPYGNYSLISYGEGLTSISDFKVEINSSWGEIQTLAILGFNDYGDELFFVRFDVTGKSTANLNNWFIGSNIDDTSMGIDEPNTLSTVVSDGVNEMIIMSSGETWFSILHSDTVDPKMVLAVNSSGTLSTAIVDFVYDDCWADWELNLTFSYKDETSLTIATCALTCHTDFVALQLAKNCFCAEFKTQHSPLAHMCTEDCPRSTGYKCGSTNDGFYSVYSVTTQPNTSEILQEPPYSAPLLTLTFTGGWNHTINVSSELLSRGWTDMYIYVDQISVDATNSSGHTMLFSFLYLYDSTDHYIEYEDKGNTYFDTDGKPVKIRMLFVEGLRILYEWDIVNSTVVLYGPPDNSYVDIPMIAVFAEFVTTSSTTIESSTDASTSSSTATSADVATSSTTGSSTDAATSTTDVPSTTTSNISTLYYLFDNQSILVNGTLYCPCNETSNFTQTPNLTSIYSDSNKTFEELIADLTLDADTLSLNRRKYNSATDNRASAATLGTLGIALIISSISFIVYLDSARLVLEATKIKKTYRILKKRLSKRSLKVEAIKVECKEEPDIPDILK